VISEADALDEVLDSRAVGVGDFGYLLELVVSVTFGPAVEFGPQGELRLRLEVTYPSSLN